MAGEAWAVENSTNGKFIVAGRNLGAIPIYIEDAEAKGIVLEGSFEQCDELADILNNAHFPEIKIAYHEPSQWNVAVLNQILPETSSEPSINEVLEQRGGKYGLFPENAGFAQEIKDLFRRHPGWQRLSLSQREAFDLMATKFSRCMTGDPTYKDNWTDLGGYALLIAAELSGEPM